MDVFIILLAFIGSMALGVILCLLVICLIALCEGKKKTKHKTETRYYDED